MCLEQLYPAFDYQGGLGWSRFYLSGDSLPLHLGLREPLLGEWRARPRSGLVCVL